jgi:hypothetical protein
MTLELKKTLTNEFIKSGIAVVIMAVVVYFQRLDYMKEINEIRADSKETNAKFNHFILNEYRIGINIIEKNNDVLDRFLEKNN